MASSSSSSPEHSSSSDSSSSRILSGKYLLGHSNKKDLVLRLRTIVQLLREDDNIEADYAEYPGLAALCHALLGVLDHRDKLVRLYTVSACMELFAIYAPEAPWETAETLEIFRQTIRQLANLSHTTLPSQTHYAEYLRILELLASVKIGVLLVDLTKDDGSFGEEALQVLGELFRTVLQSVRFEHPPEIAELAQQTIGGCLEEYYEGFSLPVPLLDELLVCIGQGPTVLVINPQKANAQAQAQKSKKPLPPHQVEQANPSYLVASAVVRKTVDRLSTPIATLLNGLLNKDARMVAESSILTHSQKTMATPQPQNQLLTTDVWSIVYELHKIAPTILTTVIGTLANYFTDPQNEQRLLVVKLLGRMFVKSSSSNNNLALQFRPCFRDWLRRINDVALEIRLVMVDYLLLLIPHAEEQLAVEVQPLLKQALDDPSSQVRLQTIHGLCDVAYRHRTSISMDLWQAVGNRVSSKHRQERKDALTGLAQTYYKQYVVYHLTNVQAGGDDCPLEVVQDTLQKAENDCERYAWIPSKGFECASWTEDGELQSRVLQLMDDLLLGSELPNSTKTFTATARAVGLAVVIDQLQPNAQSWMRQLWQQRAKLQQALADYLEARSQIKTYPAGSEEALTANAKALDLLESVASWTNLSMPTTPGERHPTVEQFHVAKDKHIFRILSTISTPTHSPKARVRALEELPKRVKPLGDNVCNWVKGLVRRCAMGDFINKEIVHHAILLAQECYHQDDLEACQKFLKPVQLAADSFPQLCATQDSFSNLLELFTECRSVKQNKQSTGIVTTLSAILAKAAPNTGQSLTMDDGLHKQLLNLCCRDGTPEQARHAVSTMAALLQHGAMTQEQTDAFAPLLKSLASPSKLNRKNKSLVSVLVALAELANSAPKVLASTKGEKAIQFALEMVLLGRSHSTDGEDGDEDSNSDNEDQQQEQKEDLETPSRRRRKSTKRQSQDRKHMSPGAANLSLLEDETLSVSCRILCAAIEFLVSYIRSSILFSRSMISSQKLPPRASRDNDDKEKNVSQSSNSKQAANLQPPNELIEKVFDILSQILRDEGLPPSTHDRRECRLRQDRAALRQCSAIHLLRLCDTRLYLDHLHLTPARWHTLAAAFLDDERVVRDKIMGELGFMLTGHGKYGKCHGSSRPMAPRLRFLALVVLCTDGDHGADHSGANGNAANVGKRSSNTKTNATECIASLRKTYDVTAEQARAIGADAERQFETQMKVMLMPEYVVPYAFHLLSFRRETPSAGGSTYSKSTGLTQTSQEDENYEVDEGQQKVLRKRLKWLFDPLVLSLGDSADNISFLLRMTEMMGKFFQPAGISEKRSAPASRLSPGSDSDSDNMLTGERKEEDNTELESAKIKIVCAAAREVLLSYVKKDVNLDTYPGTIQLPGNLFRRRSSLKKRASRSKEQASKQTNRGRSRSAEGRSAKRGSDRMASSSPVARLEKKYDSVEGPINPDSSQESIPTSSFSQASKQDESAASRTRGSAASSQSVEDYTTHTVDDSIASRTRRSQGSSRSGASSSNQTAASKNSEPKRRRSSRQSPLPRSNSIGDGHVHFSPELTIRNVPGQRESTNFGGLSPINTKLSPAGDKSVDALLSSGEKTRGTTPPSVVRNTRFTASASLALTGATVSAESPSSKISEARSASRSADSNSMIMGDEGDRTKITAETQSSEGQKTKSTKSSMSKKRPSPDKEQVDRKRRKGSVPTQIKIVRHKPRDLSPPKRNTSTTRGSSKKNPTVDDDDLDFDGGSEFESVELPQKTARKGKENRAAPKKAAARRAPKRGLRSRN